LKKKGGRRGLVVEAPGLLVERKGKRGKEEE
jgi:hypothetical protein